MSLVNKPRDIEAFVTALKNYRPDATHFNSLAKSAERVGISLAPLSPKFKSGTRGINPAFFSEKAPQLYPSRAETSAYSLLALYKVDKNAAEIAGADFMHQFGEDISIQGKYFVGEK